MDKDIARRLLKLINKPDLLEDLFAYIDYRIELNTKHLYNENDEVKIRKLQGAIRELYEFKAIGESVRGEMRHG